MKKTIKNLEMVTIINELGAFIEKDVNMPVKLSYAISKNMKNLRKEADVYIEQREKILSELKDNKLSEQEANEKMKELFDIENEIEICTVTEDDIFIIENISTKDLLSIDFMIE